MKLWLDDVRTPPDETWTWVKTCQEAMNRLVYNDVVHVSFDHDLGTELTGYDLAKEIEKMAYHRILPSITWSIHSANPVGRRNIEMAMMNADKYWGKIDS